MEGIRYRRVCYEAFTQDPLEIVNQVLGWLGAKADDPSWIEGRSVSLSATHTVGGSPHRFSTGTIRLRQDDAWKDNLDRDEIKYVERWAGRLMDRYGYDRMH
jgi:hypothetical protein